jgi:hypothetical protein
MNEVNDLFNFCRLLMNDRSLYLRITIFVGDWQRANQQSVHTFFIRIAKI